MGWARGDANASFRGQAMALRAPPDADGLVQELDSASADQLQELTYVDMGTFLATL